MWPDFSELTVLEDLRYSASWLHRQSTKKNPKSGFSQHGFDSGNSEWTRPTMTSVCRMLHPLHVNQRCVRSFTALQTTNFKQIPLSQKKKPVQWFSCFGFFFLLKTLIFFHLFFPQSLLDEPNPNSPANSQAAQLYQENKREYEKRVTAIVEQSWVDVWASPRRYLLLPLHRPLFFIIPVLQSLIFTSSRKKTATISEELKCHPEKMEE